MPFYLTPNQDGFKPRTAKPKAVFIEIIPTSRKTAEKITMTTGFLFFS